MDDCCFRCKPSNLNDILRSKILREHRVIAYFIWIPTIYIFDRPANVTSLIDISNERDTRKVIASEKRQEGMEAEDNNDLRHHMHNFTGKVESISPDFLPKPAPLGPSGTTSLLGMPGRASSAMMAAAFKGSESECCPWGVATNTVKYNHFSPSLWLCKPSTL
ncbi:unnamed protein product [Schistosoma rodhaini]|uniref:Uncharacterized protein n=1 Tax=Schistosoma rodhaini TaxID=6188 RepID=A0AA85FBT3_9TREM|nr:unnamed protein product [Schistosoma rodhaini]